MDAQLILGLADGESGEALLDDESGDAVVALALVGHREDDERVCIAAVGDEDLSAVQEPVVAHVDSLGLLSGCVGTRVGFGQTESAELLAGEQVGQVLCLLLVSAVVEDRPAAQGSVSRDDNSSGCADSGEFFHSDRIRDVVGAGAAVFSGERNAHHTELSHLFDIFLGESVFLIDVSSDGFDFGKGKFPYQFSYFLLLFR